MREVRGTQGVDVRRTDYTRSLVLLGAEVINSS